MVAVSIRVENDLPMPSNIPGVFVEVFDISAIMQSSGITDINGVVQFSLPEGDYDVLFYKVGVSILPKQPQRITVDALLLNGFIITAHEYSPPESIDPLRCTVHGYILGIDGLKAKNKLVFSLVSEPLIIGGNLIEIASRLEVNSDDDGHFEFELLREQEYWAYFLYLESFLDIPPPARLLAVIPDRPSVELSKLLFPVPVMATFFPTSVSLIAGADPDTDGMVDVMWSDNSIRWASYAWVGLKVVNDHPEVVEASVSAGTMILKPLSPGTALVTIERIGSSKVSFIPVELFSTNVLVVTVL